jgi:ATP-binding cassette subfamily B multidrug efflux pump
MRYLMFLQLFAHAHQERWSSLVDAKLRQAIHKLGNKTTTFIVSQRIAGIRQADNILVLNNGELVGQGTHNELMGKCQVYREIYFSQFPEERKFYEGGVRV